MVVNCCTHIKCGVVVLVVVQVKEMGQIQEQKEGAAARLGGVVSLRLVPGQTFDRIINLHYSLLPYS